MNSHASFLATKDTFARAASAIRRICPPHPTGPQHEVWEKLRDALDQAISEFRAASQNQKSYSPDILDDISKFNEFLDPRDGKGSVYGNSSSAKNYRTDIKDAKSLYRTPAILAWLWHRSPSGARSFFKYVSDYVVSEEATPEEKDIFASRNFEKIERFVQDFLDTDPEQKVTEEPEENVTDIEKTCFVIMPFTAGSDYESKKHFDYVYTSILSKACIAAGYTPKRADSTKRAAFIMQDILTDLLSSDMVLADISRNNPNVMYEIGVRHAARKPVVIVKDSKTESVFNVKDIRIQEYPSYPLSSEDLALHVENIADALMQTAQDPDLKNSPFQLLPDSLTSALGGTRVFGGRKDITADSGFPEAIQSSQRLDMVSLAAEVAMQGFRETFVQAVTQNNLKCRLVIYSPNEDTELQYDMLVKQNDRRPSQKRDQAQDLIDFARRVNEESGDPHRVQVKLLSKTQLFYNIWLAYNDKSPRDSVGHISVYGYGIEGGPAFRAYGQDKNLFTSCEREFDYVWNTLAVDVT